MRRLEAPLETKSIRRQVRGQGVATLASTIAEKLRLAVIRGELAPGERLRLGELSKAFDVSLSPLREAMSRLSSEGFLIVEDQRGFSAPPVSEENLSEIVQLRRDFEIYALREAIQKGDLEWETAVTAALYRLERTDRSDPTQGEQWEERHREFHLALASACKMPLLLNMCEMLHDHFDRYRRLFLANSPPDPRVPTEHRRIAEASIGRRMEEACAAMRKHIERAGNNALEAVHRMRPATDGEDGKTAPRLPRSERAVETLK
jgi:GntR family transcriptional regulator, carbon starvation induced regulator